MTDLTATPHEALDRLLALRPDDLDGWEEPLADELTEAERASIEADDRALDDLLAGWAAHDVEEEAAPLPLGLFAEPEPRRRRRARGRTTPAWVAPAALAASLAVVGFAMWQLRPEPEPGLKAVSPLESTRVDLQFGVERAGRAGVHVVPGRNGGTYGGDDALALRLQVQGEGGWLYLLEVGEAGNQLLFPVGEGRRVDAGVHGLTSATGEALVYRPDAPGAYRYVALITDEPVDPLFTLQGVLEAGAPRPDLWPRHVLSVDDLRLTWEN